MGFALRVLVMVAAVMPLFAATAFHPTWWQTLIAAAIGSAVGQLVVRFTRGRRIAAWSAAGVAALIAAGAVGWSLRHTTRHAEPSGKTIIVVRSTDRASLTWHDVQAIKGLPSIELAAPYLTKQLQLQSEDSNWATEVVGTTPDYFDLRGWNVGAGDRFDASEPGKRVVVLGETTVRQLYGAGKSPVGEEVRIANTPYTIVGILAHHGMSPQGQDLDDVALIPVDVFANKIVTTISFGGIVLISPAPHVDPAQVEADVRSVLRDRHRMDPGADDAFVIARVPL